MRDFKKQLTKWGPIFFLAILLVVIYKMLDNFGDVVNFCGNFISIMAPFLMGVLIAYLLYIPSKSLEQIYEKSKMRLVRKKARTLGIFTAYLIATLIIIIIIKVVWPVIFKSVIELAGNIQEYYSIAISRFNDLPNDSWLKSSAVKEYINNLQTIDVTKYINMSDLTGYFMGILSAAGKIFDVVVALIVSVYVLSGRKNILKFMKNLAAAIFNKKTFNNIGKYFNSTNQIFFKFLSSQFLDAIVVGILTTIAMSIMGVKYAALLGFMIGLFNMIPYFGAIIAVIIAALITIMTGGLAQAIWMIIIVIILQQIDANIINPKILGNSLKISPLLVIIAVTIGGAYFGVIGMFLAVPIAAALKIVIMDYIEYKKKINLKTSS